MTPRLLVATVLARGGPLPGFPELLLFAEISGAAFPLWGRPPGGQALVLLPGGPIARRVELSGPAVERLVEALEALSWPQPKVYDQHDTSGCQLSLRIEVTLATAEGRLAVSLMGGSYQGPEAPALRAFLDQLVTELGLPFELRDALRA